MHLHPKSTFMACLSTSDTPDCFEITTGTLLRMASRGTIPKGSETDGITNTSGHSQQFLDFIAF
jgi:hypothetical protein